MDETVRYRVAIVDGRVDDAATARLRAGPRASEARHPFDYGAEREAWEAVFDDASMLTLNDLLMGLPAARRNAARGRLIADVVPDLDVGAELTAVIDDPKGMKERLGSAMHALLKE